MHLTIQDLCSFLPISIAKYTCMPSTFLGSPLRQAPSSPCILTFSGQTPTKILQEASLLPCSAGKTWDISLQPSPLSRKPTQVHNLLLLTSLFPPSPASKQASDPSLLATPVFHPASLHLLPTPRSPHGSLWPAACHRACRSSPRLSQRVSKLMMLS